MKYLLLVIGLLFLIPACTTEPTQQLVSSEVVAQQLAARVKAAAQATAYQAKEAEKIALAEAGILELSEILSDFSDNGVVAELKYHDETLTISGVIDAISSSASGGRTFVTVARSREWQSSMSLLLCEVELSAVLELKRDDPIIVTGFFQSELTFEQQRAMDSPPSAGFWLSGCSIVTDQYRS